MTQQQADAKPAQLEMLVVNNLGGIFSRNNNRQWIQLEPKGRPQLVYIPKDDYYKPGDPLLAIMQACEPAAKKLAAEETLGLPPNACVFGRAEDTSYDAVAIPVQFYIIS